MSAVLQEAPAAKQKPRSFVLKGVMQAPVTPLHDDFSVDYDGLAKMVDFHVRNGAPALSLGAGGPSAVAGSAFCRMPRGRLAYHP